MSILRKYRLFRHPLLKRFARTDDGVAAIEFGFLAIPFFYIIMATLETSLVSFAETNLTTSVETAARVIRVGAFGTGDPGEDKSALFIQSVCDNAVMVPDCATNLKVDVRTMTQFAQGAGLGSIDACLDSADPANFDVTPGTSSALMLVRVCYRWELVTPFMSQVFSYPAGSGYRTLSSVIAFRNEPYAGSGTIGSGTGG